MALNFLNDGYFAGKVGIGTNLPGGKLDIAYTGTGGTGTFGIGEGLNISSLTPNITFNDNSTSVDNYAIHLNQSVFTLGRYTSSTSQSPDLVLKSGNVGIGTTGPSEKLEVAGNILLESTGQELQFANHNVGAYRDGNNRLILGGYGGIHFKAEALSGMDNQATRMVINNVGAIQFNAYSSTNNTGTPTYMLGTDASGNVVKVLGGDIPGGGGTVTGSGTATQVAFWDTSTSLSGNNKLYWDNTNGCLGINDSTPSSRLKVVGAESDTSIYTVDIRHIRNNPNVGTHAMRLNVSLTGADNTTADRLSSGLLVDIDSSANGDASNEHRIYGVNSSVNFTGFTDLARGGYFLAESNYTGAKTSQLIGVFGNAVHDVDDVAGGVSNMMGVYGTSSIQDKGDVDNAYGGFFSVVIPDSRTETVGTTIGVQGEVEINKATALNYGTMIGVSSLIDNNETTFPNFGSQYLFKGDYQGTRGGNAYGIYCEGDKHYFEGKVGIGVTGADYPFSLEDGGTGLISRIYNTNADGQGLLIRAGATTSATRAFQVASSNDTKIMTVNSNGNVGIGTASPAAKLHVVGTGLFTGLVSGITPVAAANFVTKAYVDGGGGAGSGFLPLSAGSGFPLTNTLYGTNTNWSGDGDYAGNMTLGTGASTAEAHLQIGQGRTGNGYSYIDLIGDATYTDYGLRIIRNNGGPNTTSAITHRGTGNFSIGATDSASILLKTNNTLALTLNSSQNAIFAGSIKTTQIEIESAVPSILFDETDVTANWRNRVQSGGYRIQYASDGTTFVDYLTLGASANTIEKETTFKGDVVVDGASITIDTDTAGNSLTWKESDSSTTAGQLRGYANRGDIYLYASGVKTTEISASTDSFIPALHIGGTSAATGGVLQTTGNVNIDGSADISATVTATTFSGDLNGTINTATTGVTQVNSVDNTTIATTAYVNNKIALIPAGLLFEGTWDARTVAEGGTGNLPSASPANGQFWIVSVAGSINLSGITDWKVGDWAIYVVAGAGTDGWQKVDNSSVLDGSGTGNQSAKWAGSGTSNTLTNGSIEDEGTILNAIRINSTTTTTKNYIGMGMDSTNNQRLSLAEADSNGSHIRMVNSRSGGGYFVVGVGDTNSSSNIVPPGGMFFYNGVTRMVINSSGNVGIGTTSPISKFTVTGTDNTNQANIGHSTQSVFIKVNGTNVDYNSSGNSGGSHTFSTGNIERMRITVGGNVGIGATTGFNAVSSTETTLYIKNTNVASLYLDSTANNGNKWGIYSAAAGQLAFYDFSDGSERMRVDSAGNVGIGTTSPVEKLQVEGKVYIQGNGQDWNETTPGPTRGSVHFDPGTTTADTGNALTFGASDTPGSPNEGSTAHAGIYTRSDGAYGSKMYFATTDSYAVGSKTRMMIDYNGNVGIGTTSPERILHLDADQGRAIIQLDKGGDKIVSIGTGSSATGADDTILQLLNEGVEKVRIFTEGSSYFNGGNVGIGVTGPQSKLQVAGGIQMADDTATASAAKAGTMRYRTGTEYVEVDGTEIIVDGDFSTPASWVTETGWSITGGQLVASGVTGSNSTYQVPGLVAGKIYRVQFEITAYTSGTIKLAMGTSSTGSFFSGVGVHTDIVTAAGTLQARFYNGTQPVSLTIDNASVIEVTAEDASYADMCMQTGSSTYEWVNIVRNTY